MKNPLLIVIVSTCWLCSCSPVFVARSAYEEAKILFARQKISDLVKDPTADPELKRKLTIVLDTREFAIRAIGVTPKNGFTLYSEVDKDTLLWVLAASPPDSFQLYTWWFPIVGEIPYMGFFDKDGAVKEGRHLKDLGYEGYIRGSDAFSTLGWFNDPVLSTTLRRNDPQIVNTVIHESVHSTIWIRDQVPFNESLANFVGFEGAIQYFKSRNDKLNLELATDAKEFEFELANTIESLYQELSELYSSYAPREIKLSWRERIFQRYIAPLKIRNPELNIFQTPNNAEIMQFKFYLSGFNQFQRSFDSCSQSWSCFFGKITSVKNSLESSNTDSHRADSLRATDPFDILKRIG